MVIVAAVETQYRDCFELARSAMGRGREGVDKCFISTDYHKIADRMFQIVSV